MDITHVFGTWVWGSSPYETARKIMSLRTYRKFKKTDTEAVINLFVRKTNIKVKAFYKTNNYEKQDAQIYVKRLIRDN